MAEDDFYRENPSVPEPELEPEPPAASLPEEKGEPVFSREEEKGVSGEEVPEKEEITPSKAAPLEEKKLPPYFKKKDLKRWLEKDPKAFALSGGMKREKRIKIPDQMEEILKKYRSNLGTSYNIKPREMEKTLKVLRYQERFGRTKDEKGHWRTLEPAEKKEARQTKKLLEGYLKDWKSGK